MKKLTLIVGLFVVIGKSNMVLAQIGGRSTFAFLDRPWNANIGSIGAVNVSVYDRYVNLFQSNPALINEKMERQLSLNMNPYFAGTANSSVTYAQKIPGLGLVAGSVNYANYGTFNQYDITGLQLGTFTASEYVITAGYAHKMGNFATGVNVKFAGSNIETYSSHALAMDLGSIFRHPTRDFTVGLVIKNIGFATDSYTGSSSSSLPLNVQLGSSYKLEHMPLRFSLTLQQLQKYDVTYLDGTISSSLDASGKPVYPSKSTFDKIFRHFVFGGEFIFSNNFRLNAGWNILMNRELKLKDIGGGAGFSLGGVLKVKAFELSIGHGYYTPVGGTTYLTLTTDFTRLFKSRAAKSTATEPETVKP